jgi:hypothetical protein
MRTDSSQRAFRFAACHYNQFKTRESKCPYFLKIFEVDVILLAIALEEDEEIHSYHSHSIPEGVAEAFQIFLRDAHVLPKLFLAMRNIIVCMNILHTRQTRNIRLIFYVPLQPYNNLVKVPRDHKDVRYLFKYIKRFSITVLICAVTKPLQM